MKKKVLALALAAALGLSSTSAFAATTNCTTVTTKYDINNILKNYSVQTNKSNVTYKVTINGKTVDINSIDLNSLLTKAQTTEQKNTATKPVAQKPATTQTTAQKPATTQTTTQKPATAKPAEQKPATTQTPVQKPATTQTTTQKPATTQTTTQKPATTTQTTTQKPATTAPAQTNTTNASTSVSAYEQKVVELVNVERAKAGLPALKLDTAMSSVARTKSQDMASNNYFAHQSPTYGSAGDMLTRFGIKWSAWGENIAYGQKTPEAVVTAWMNSAGHRANIMSSNYSRIGVGYVTNANGTPYWTQMFAN
jgi:uncharacterized YkwD family protein